MHSDALHHGQRLEAGDHLTSLNGRYVLILQKDGNLVLYDGESPVWASNTCGQPVAFAQLAEHHFALHAADGHVLWKVDTHGADRVVVQNDRNVVAYKRDGSAPWASGTVNAEELKPRDRIRRLETLRVGDSLKSGNGKYVLFLQEDGNLVLYEGDHPHWASNTAGQKVTHLAFAGRHLGLYNGDHLVWHADCDGAAFVVIQNDRNVVAYRPDSSAAWASNSCA